MNDPSAAVPLVLAIDSWHNERVQASWRAASREDLITELERRERDNERLREQLERERARYRQERDRLRKKIERLEDELDDARRTLHRLRRANVTVRIPAL